jgi:heptosyltransferase-3
LSRILVIRGGALGDFILTLPAIRLLREAFPAAHLEVLGYRHIACLAEMSGYANATRSIEFGAFGAFFSRDGELAPELVEYFGSFHQVVSYLFDPDEIFAANLRRAGVRNLITGSPRINDEEHAARQLARPLQRLALFLENLAAEIVPNESAVVDPRRIAIHPGSGSERKNWPLERFLALVQSLLAEDEARRFLLVGGEADEARLAQLESVLPNEKREIARNLPLPALAARLQNCALFLGHDSGVSHLAAAVGTPAVLLFGPTDPAVWAPQNPAVRVLRPAARELHALSLEDVQAEVRDRLRVRGQLGGG